MSLEKLPTDHAPVLQRIGKRRLIVIAGTVLVILALATGGIAAALLSQDHPAVTILPDSRVMSHNYTVSALTGQPDPSQDQVQARLVSATTPTHTKSVQASGHLSTQAASARGTVELYNWDSRAPVTFQAGTVFPDNGGSRVVLCTNSDGIDMVLDATVTVPAADPTKGFSEVDAPAHVQERGTVGNISGKLGTFYLSGELDPCYNFMWLGQPCSGGWLHFCWTIDPDGPFTGGQDTYDGPVVQQSDIDTAVHALVSASQSAPEQVLASQVRAGEQLIGTPQCTPQVSPSGQAGDQVPQVTVKVSFACSGEVYDQHAAFSLATRMLTTQAASETGADYVLMGQIKTALISTVFGDQGRLLLTIEARGMWAYHFTDAQQQQLANLLAGKSEAEALQVADNQPGVAYAMVHLPANQQRLPTDPQQIVVVVQDVPGV